MNPLKIWHLDCLAAWKTFSGRMKNKPKLKEWWEALPDEQKAQWFRVNAGKKKRNKNGEREFDCVGYTVVSRSVGNDKKIRDQAKTYDTYFREHTSIVMNTHPL